MKKEENKIFCFYLWKFESAACAGIYAPDHRIKWNLLEVCHIYIKESVYAFVDAKLHGKAAFV